MNLERIQSVCSIRLVDDDEGLRDALSDMLSYAGWIVETYPDAKSFLTSVRPSQPGCAVIDFLMPGMNGLDLVQEMNSRGIGIPVIFLTGHANLDLAIAGFREGAVDFLKKPVDEDELLRAIEKASARSYLDRLGLPDENTLQRILSSMAERERAVLRLTAAGVPPRGIAERLGITDRTVYEYRTGIYKKLGTKSLEDLPC